MSNRFQDIRGKGCTHVHLGTESWVILLEHFPNERQGFVECLKNFGLFETDRNVCGALQSNKSIYFFILACYKTNSYVFVVELK